MNSIVPLVRWALFYGLNVFAASLAGTIPPALYLFIAFLSDSRATFAQILGATLVAGLACLIMVVLPFCLFIAAPIAIIINHFVKLTLIRTLGLAVLLTGPGIIFMDYHNYLSGGPDSGPPTEPYSLTHLAQSLASTTDIFLMVVIPTFSALLCAVTLWYLRFKDQQPAR